MPFEAIITLQKIEEIMKTDEIEILDFETEVEVLGVDNSEVALLDNEDAFIVEIDNYSDDGSVEIIDMDDMLQDDVL